MSDSTPPPVPLEETASAWEAPSEPAATPETLAYEPPPSQPSPPVVDQPARRRWPIVVALLAVAAVLGTIAVLLVVVDDEPDRVVLPDPSEVPPLGPSAQSLVDLLADGRKRTFHVRYQLTGASGVVGIEHWNQPGRTRVDTVNEADGERILTASIVDGSRAFSCRRDGDADWACSRVETPPGGRFPLFFDTVEAQLRGRSVKESEATIDGRQAKCFSVGESGAETEPVEMCVTVDGVPLRVASATASIQAEVVDQDVPDSIFTPPAAVG